MVEPDLATPSHGMTRIACDLAKDGLGETSGRGA